MLFSLNGSSLSLSPLLLRLPPLHEQTMASQLHLPSSLLLVMVLLLQTSTAQDITFQFKFDPTLERLGNLGTPDPMPSGHAGQNPAFRAMSVHYIELAPTQYTQLGKGQVIYHAPETTAGGAQAIDAAKGIYAGAAKIFFRYPLRNITAGTYEWLRVSVAYQNYDVDYNLLNVTYLGHTFNITAVTGHLASYVGFNTYITKATPDTLSVNVNSNELQGFFAFELGLSGLYASFNKVITGASPAGATTVVNPIASTSPIPAGSCVVTGQFSPALVISADDVSGAARQDINVILAFSTNNSFEWVDTNGNSEWDIDPVNGPEVVVDMGLRGLFPQYTRSAHQYSSSSTAGALLGGTLYLLATLFGVLFFGIVL